VSVMNDICRSIDDGRAVSKLLRPSTKSSYKVGDLSRFLSDSLRCCNTGVGLPLGSYLRPLLFRRPLPLSTGSVLGQCLLTRR